MAVVEDIELRVTVNGLQAQKALDETRASAEKMGGGLSTVIAKLDGLQKGAQSLQQKMAPAAAAISGVSAALGQAGGEAGKLVAGVGQLAAAFGSGGPYAAALVAGSLVVDALTKSWERQIEVQNQAIDAMADSTAKAAASLALARGELAKARAQDMPEEWQRAATLKQRIAEIDAKMAAEQARTLTALGRQRAGISEQERADIATAIRQLEKEKATVIETNKVLEDRARREKEKAGFDAFRAKEEAAREAAAAKARDQRQRDNAASAQLMVDMMAEEERQLRAVTDARREAAAEREQIELQRMGMSLSGGFGADAGPMGGGVRGTAGPQTELQAMAVEAAKNAAAAADWSLAWQKAGAQVAESFGGVEATATGVLSALTSGTQQYVDDVITGQENAAQALAVMLMRTAGQSLISSGVDLGGKAIVSALTPGLQPLAAAQAAASAGLIASGVALGGAATGIEHMAAGGQIGQKLPDASGGGGDPGARARAPRTMPGEGGGTNLTIVYGGLSGPTADDGARALKKAERRAARRGYK